MMPVPKHSSMSLDFQYFRDTLNDLNTCWIKRLSLANYCSNFWLASAVSNTGMLLGYFCRRITLFKNISAKYTLLKLSKDSNIPAAGTAAEPAALAEEAAFTYHFSGTVWLAERGSVAVHDHSTVLPNLTVTALRPAGRAHRVQNGNQRPDV